MFSLEFVNLSLSILPASVKLTLVLLTKSFYLITVPVLHLCFTFIVSSFLYFLPAGKLSLKIKNGCRLENVTDCGREEVNKF